MGYETWHQSFWFCACSHGGKHPIEQTHSLGRKGSSEAGKVRVTTATKQQSGWTRLCSNTPESEWKMVSPGCVCEGNVSGRGGSVSIALLRWKGRDGL